MPTIPGRTVPLSPLRRVVCDWLHFSQQTPLVALERRMRLAAVVAARQAASPRPGWFALFVKAFALAAVKYPELRRSYIPWPWPRLYEHPHSIAVLPIERRVGDEAALMHMQLHKPESEPLLAIEAAIRRAKEQPLEDCGSFRRTFRLARMPWPLRRLVWHLGLHVSGKWRQRYFGTFVATGVASLGASSLHILSPLTCTFAASVFEPDGSVMLRLMYDHRVMDGVAPARALAEVERLLTEDLLAELHALPATSAA